MTVYHNTDTIFKGLRVQPGSVTAKKEPWSVAKDHPRYIDSQNTCVRRGGEIVRSRESVSGLEGEEYRRQPVETHVARPLPLLLKCPYHPRAQQGLVMRSMHVTRLPDKAEHSGCCWFHARWPDTSGP